MANSAKDRSPLVLRSIRNERSDTFGDCRSSLAPSCRNATEEIAVRGRSRAELIERTRQLMEQTIEFVPNPEFDRPGFSKTLSAMMPRSIRHPQPPEPSGPGLAFVSALVQAPLLSHQDEEFCFLQMNFLKSRAERNRRKLDLRRPNQSLIEKIESDLAEAMCVRNHIVLGNVRLIVATARKLTASVERMSDLISEGMTPLIRAVELFNVAMGNRFSTYATWAVRNQMIRLLKRARQSLEILPGEDTPSLENLPDKSNLTDSEEQSPTIRKQIVDRLLSSLSDRERIVVTARFALEGQPRGQSLAMIAGQIGLSKERVRQILLQSLEKLRSEMTIDEVDSIV